MSENDNRTANVVDCPTEVLWKIFSYLKAKQLPKCREVCLRWKHVIDELCKSEEFWMRHCEIDFNDCCKSAHCKRSPKLSWRDLYRSLALWPRLQEATETRDEFASASSVHEEIQDFQLLRYGEVGVHCPLIGIVFYDLHTLKRSRRSTISGNYSKYVENDHVILIHGLTSDLYVIRKYIRSPLQEAHTSFPHVKCFLLADNLAYYATLDNEIFVCDFLKDKRIEHRFIVRLENRVTCLGYKDGLLNILTYEREIYRIVSPTHIDLYNLDDVANLMHCMHRFNFLEHLDWMAFFHWMFILNRPMPQSCLRDVIIAKVYGDVVFFGTRFGVFLIYYAPYINNEFDLFNSEPLKQYNFMERRDCPVLSDCAIMQIDVMESENGHTVLVGMPKKIVLLKFSHDFRAREPQFEIDNVQNV